MATSYKLISQKSFIGDVWLGYKYVSVADGMSLISKEINFFFRDVVENVHPSYLLAQS